MADTKVIDEVHHISRKHGNGQLRREVWVGAGGRVTRYNLAYISHALHSGDNGRVVGYDKHIARAHIRKEDVVAKVLAKRGDEPGLVHVISAMETCATYQPWHDKDRKSVV